MHALLVPHLHVPIAQVSVVVLHAVPHAPQLLLSEVVSAHLPVQQISVPLHFVPHAPQLSVSVETATHLPSHGISPAPGHLHLPSTQVVSPSQAVAQLPQ